MVNKLIQAMIAIVIGLALLPVVVEFVDDLTAAEGALDGTASATLVELLPILYVIILVSGVATWVYTSVRN